MFAISKHIPWKNISSCRLLRCFPTVYKTAFRLYYHVWQALLLRFVSGIKHPEMYTRFPWQCEVVFLSQLVWHDHPCNSYCQVSFFIMFGSVVIRLNRSNLCWMLWACPPLWLNGVTQAYIYESGALTWATCTVQISVQISRENNTHTRMFTC